MSKVFGIDVSKWQGNFDFKNAQRQGVKFAILRAGYTGSSDGVSKAIDEKYERNYKECKKLGIGVGAYWYSRATSKAKGEAEAKFMYEKCLKGKQFEYPIYIDVEDTVYQKKTSKKNVTSAIKGFCEYLENKGYWVGIYASDISGFKEMMNIDDLKAYDKWVARYGSEPKYVKEYGMWQFSSSNGKIKGAGNSLDLDYAYKDYPKIMKEKGKNGFKKQTTAEIPSNSSSSTPNSNKTTKYYKKYTGKSNSIVDALNSLKIDSSFSYRRKIAKANGIKAYLYLGTKKQNEKMLNLLKQGKLIKA